MPKVIDADHIAILLLAFVLLATIGLILGGHGPTGNVVLEDLLVNENLGDEYGSLTAHHWAGLAGGEVATQEGRTAYSQYIVFKDPAAADPIESCTVRFDRDESGAVGDFLHCKKGDEIFEYQLIFEQGLESGIDDDQLEDIEDARIMMLGQEFIITSAETDGSSIRLRLSGRPVEKLMAEGEKHTIVHDDETYTVRVVSISDTTPPRVVLEVDSQTSSALEEKKAILIRNKFPIIVHEIIPNEGRESRGQDLVNLVFGARSLDVRDDDYTDDAFTRSEVRVNGRRVIDAKLKIKAARAGGLLTISSIMYRLQAAGPQGDVYIPAGQGLAENMRNPYGLLSSAWDLRYGGVGEGQAALPSRPSGAATIKFDARSDGYDLEFTNNNGISYDIPLLTKRGGTLAYGDDDNDLHFREGADASDYLIGEKEYFIVTKGSDGRASTHVLQFEGTADGKAVFTDLSGKSKILALFPTGAFFWLEKLFKGRRIEVPLSALTGNQVFTQVNTPDLSDGNSENEKQEPMAAEQATQEQEAPTQQLSEEPMAEQDNQEPDEQQGQESTSSEDVSDAAPSLQQEEPAGRALSSSVPAEEQKCISAKEEYEELKRTYNGFVEKAEKARTRWEDMGYANGEAEQEWQRLVKGGGEIYVKLVKARDEAERLCDDFEASLPVWSGPVREQKCEILSVQVDKKEAEIEDEAEKLRQGSKNSYAEMFNELVQLRLERDKWCFGSERTPALSSSSGAPQTPTAPTPPPEQAQPQYISRQPAQSAGRADACKPWQFSDPNCGSGCASGEACEYVEVTVDADGTTTRCYACIKSTDACPAGTIINDETCAGQCSHDYCAIAAFTNEGTCFACTDRMAKESACARAKARYEELKELFEQVDKTDRGRIGGPLYVEMLRARDEAKRLCDAIGEAADAKVPTEDQPADVAEKRTICEKSLSRYEELKRQRDALVERARQARQRWEDSGRSDEQAEGEWEEMARQGNRLEQELIKARKDAGRACDIFLEEVPHLFASFQEKTCDELKNDVESFTLKFRQEARKVRLGEENTFEETRQEWIRLSNELSRVCRGSGSITDDSSLRSFLDALEELKSYLDASYRIAELFTRLFTDQQEVVLDISPIHRRIPKATKFDASVTTDFSKKTDEELAAIPDMEVGREGAAKIEWKTPVDVRGLDLDSVISIEPNKVTVDADAAPALDAPAIITLENIDMKEPVIYKDGKPCTTCTILGYDRDAKRLTFSTAGFSTFTAIDAAGLGRGTLTLSGSSYEFFVNAAGDAIVVDLDGDGDLDGSAVDIHTAGYGILNLGAAGTTVNIVLRTSARYMENKMADEMTTIRVSITDGRVSITLPGLDTHDAGAWEEVMTSYGTHFALEDKTRGNDLVIDYPPAGQRAAGVGIIMQD